MAIVSKRHGGSLAKWSATAFILAGVLMLLAAINPGLGWITGIQGPEQLEFAGFLGMILSYIALLGLYPRLADLMPRLARAAIGLLLVPVVIILVDFVSVVLGFGPPFGVIIGTTAAFVFALGIAVLGVGCYRRGVPSRAVGRSLLVYAVSWFLLLGTGLLNGFPPADAVTFVTTVLMAGALLAIGYLLRADSGWADRAEPTSSEVRHG